MKKFFFCITILALGLNTPVGAANYVLDAAHCHIGFSVRHILSPVTGEFKDFEGSFTFDEKKSEASHGTFTAQIASINTSNDKRDAHLKSPDFFDVEKYPTLTFVSKKVKSLDDKKYDITGDLTIHGVTKSVVVHAEYLGSDNAFGTNLVGFTASAKIDRRDFGLVWSKALSSGNLVVGNDVTITLDISANEQAPVSAQTPTTQPTPVNQPTPAAEKK